MNKQDFRCWIDGFLTLTDDDYLDQQQFNIIKNHANLVTAVSQTEQQIVDFIEELSLAMIGKSIKMDTVRQIAADIL